LPKSSANATGGPMERGNQQFVIKSLGVLKSIDDIGEVRVSWHQGIPVHVRDVALVREGYAPRQGVVTRDNDEDAIEGIVLMRRGQNPPVVLASAREPAGHLDERRLAAPAQRRP